MQISRALLALTEGVRLRLAGVVLIGLLATAAGLASLILAGYAIGSVFAGASPAAVWPLLAAAARVALLVGGFVMLALALPTTFRKAVRRRGRVDWGAYTNLAALMVDSLQGLPTLKAFTRAKDRGREISAVAAALYRATMQAFVITF